MPQIVAEWIPALGPCEVPLLNRAVAAYWRSADYGDDGRKAPLKPERVQLAALDGKQYVILWIGAGSYPGGVPWVYRVRAYDGILRLMKRPPQPLLGRLV